ncbi:hypothetical protein BBH88_04890 [Planococcus antarcticus DSM 14505]|uniref:DUF2997 domain-containing protein n=1 Tax=Planococcus antarcticus DSM 14505 TaxID=1185653 RepID=A0ABM6D3A3_9BACL|nr:DUF2997 domain-containing protein [Planococcus antarcticus]ANU09679.1 hypothetical protein BBH88_04890 [Planococcus antarcticus DSM 14505]
MKNKKIQIRITEDGKFFAETIGMKGEECLSVIEILEELLDAETVDSDYTVEYFETELKNSNNQILKIKGE